MSEQLSPDHEKHEHLEAQSKPESEQHRREQTPEKHTEHSHSEVEAIKHKVETEAKSGKEIKVGKSAEKAAEHHYVNKELKDEALHRGLQRARKHLSWANKTLSKAVHTPVVDALSKVGEKTVARPKGILTGSIVALAGSSYVLYTAKHYGFIYNYWVVFILFAGGYAVGLILEVLWYGLTRLRGNR